MYVQDTHAAPKRIGPSGNGGKITAMEVSELGPGLWRWTASHPDWHADADWERDVGCVYYESPAATVLIDPLIPPERQRFLDALDRDVERRGLPVSILLTCAWHSRSSTSSPSATARTR